MVNESLQPVIVERINYERTFRFVRLFESFGRSIHPLRLLPALLLIVIAFVVGHVMDWMAGPVIGNSLESFGVFELFLSNSLAMISQWIDAVIHLRIGLTEVAQGQMPASTTAIGLTIGLLWRLPSWLIESHPWFTLIYGVIMMGVWSLIGGLISRQISMDITEDRTVGPTEALRYVYDRWFHYLIAPWLPVLLVLLVAGLLMLSSLILYVSFLDVIGSLLYGLALLAGVLGAGLLVVWSAGIHLVYPALSIERSSGLKAVASSLSYVLARPARWLVYNLFALIYGMISYLLLGLFVFAVLWGLYYVLGVWDQTFFDAMFPRPRLGHLTEMAVDYDALSGSSRVAATIMMVWHYLLIGLLGAYVVSYYHTTQTMIYLMLRHEVDGVDCKPLFEDDRTASSRHASAAMSEEVPGKVSGTEDVSG